MKKSLFLLIAIIVVAAISFVAYQYGRVAESETSQVSASSDDSRINENAEDQRKDSTKLEAPTKKKPLERVSKKRFSKAGLTDAEAIDLALDHGWSASEETVDFLNALVRITKENPLTDAIENKAETRRLGLDSSIIFAFGHQKQIEKTIRGDETLLSGLRDLMPLAEKEAETNFSGESAESMLTRINRVINLLDFFGHNFSEESFKNTLAAYPEPGALQKTWGGMRSAYVLLLEDPQSELGKKLIELDSEIFGP
ncbi:MAG TPA: hypothetical protein ENI11_03920 [Actinobacteria bacterium]|nr:hypothetical protein [Actinomycetota bacterium]